MTSTTHCESMWYGQPAPSLPARMMTAVWMRPRRYVRTRPGVVSAFNAAYGTRGDSALVANYDRMSINLPTSSNNPDALRIAETKTAAGKFGVYVMHTHSGDHYKGNQDPEYYAIVPLFDMNRKTGATAIVPGSHAKVDEINALRKQIGGIAVRSFLRKLVR